VPLVDSNLETTWSSLYSCLVDGVVVGYVRSAKTQYYGNDHLILKNALDLQPTQRIALIGAGFGWSAEDWIAQGLNVTATDISTWIHENKHIHAKIQILNEDSLSEKSRENIENFAGGKIDIAITEDVMPNLSDDECLELAKNLRFLAPKVVHWVSCITPSSEGSPLNMKSIEDWKALLSPDLVIRRGSDVVI
jgi:2-polyprenyl-3-methyl-5-hydroxy-6-metoxy-1,4-benzoquinol methylase